MNTKVSLRDWALYGWFAPVKSPAVKHVLSAAAWTLTLVNILKLVEDIQDLSCLE
jgi:hypothetical protein